MNSTTNIMIVDDHPTFRLGLRIMIESAPEFTVVAEASSGPEAISLIKNLYSTSERVHLVLMDIQMAGERDGIITAQEIRQIADPPSVLFLTTFENDQDIREAIEIGASGYLFKDASQEQLFHAIRSASLGQAIFAPRISSRLSEFFARSNSGDNPLSTRESEILSYLAKGKSNRSIADALFISEATVKSHLVNLYDKLEVNTRFDAVAEARRRKFIT